MDYQEVEYRCSDCGASVKSDTEECPNCGALLEDQELESNLVEIPIASNPVDIAYIESLLRDNEINYSIRDDSLNSVFGLPMGHSSRLIIQKDQVDTVNQIISDYEMGRSSEGDNSIKGVEGWLLIFCVFLVFINPIIMLEDLFIDIFDTQSDFILYSQFNIIFEIDLVVSILITLYGIYAGIKLWSIKPGAIKSANTYLDLVLIYVIISVFIAMLIIDITETSMDLSTLLAGILIKYFMISIGFVIIWKFYLKNSVRIKNTYGLL